MVKGTLYHKWAICIDPAILCTYVWFTSLHSCSCFCVFSHPVLPDLPTGWEEGYTFEGARCFIKWVGMCRETVIVRGCAEISPSPHLHPCLSFTAIYFTHAHDMNICLCGESQFDGCCESQAVLLSWTGSTGSCATCVCAGSPGLLTPACAQLWTWIFCRPVWRQKAPSALCHWFYTFPLCFASVAPSYIEAIFRAAADTYTDLIWLLYK